MEWTGQETTERCWSCKETDMAHTRGNETVITNNLYLNPPINHLGDLFNFLFVKLCVCMSVHAVIIYCHPRHHHHQHHLYPPHQLYCSHHFHRVFTKILSRWQKLWSRWRRKKLVVKSQVSGKFLKSGPLRMHFQHSGAKIRVFEQNTDIIKFWLFSSVTLRMNTLLKLE